MSGRVVKESQADVFEGVNQLSLELSDLSNGIYTIQIVKDNAVTHVTRVTKN
jgi:hypothetical protein